MMNVSEKTLHILALKVGRRLSDKKILEAFSYPLTLAKEEIATAVQEVELATKANVQILSIHDEAYPTSLKQLANPPILLWTLGTLPLFKGTLGVVGTRNATLYGKEMAYQLSKQAAERGAVIISGLARGIDTEAHKGALAKGKTVAVIGSGLGSIYPEENKELAKVIGKEGLLLSEYPMQTPPSRFQFPARNRIIAALSEKLLVIEAPLKSGSLITADEALLLKKELFALPGRVDWESFIGNHQLIKEGKAKIVTSIDDMIEGGLVSKSEINEGLLSHFGQTEVDIETLLLQTNLPLSSLNAQLMRLVLQGKIRQIPGGFYKKSS